MRFHSRTRHIAVDTDGRLFMVNLTTADISDSAGAQAILDALRKRWPWRKRLFADGAYDRTKLLDKAVFQDFVLEIVRRTDTDPGFKVLPRRSVVERTFGWMTRSRRLVRDYETCLDVSAAMSTSPWGACSSAGSPIADLSQTASKRDNRPPERARSSEQGRSLQICCAALLQINN